jgi:rhamnulose-1-phosphate aldolase
MNSNKILEASFIKEMMSTTYNMWRMGWDERNGGNISYLLNEEEVAKYLDISKVIRTMELPFPIKELANKYFVVTGSGKYFKNVMDNPEENIGIIRVSKDGSYIDILWGYTDGGRPTSELVAHFMSHVKRLEVDKNHKIVMHTHATNLLAMTFVHELDEQKITKTLWQMCTECLVVFPDGVGLIPWMIPGSDEIGIETAKKMTDHRLVIWPQHGIFGTGTSMDEVFGLIETAEKAAEIYMLIGGKMRNSMTDKELNDLAEAFGVTPVKGILNS